MGQANSVFRFIMGTAGGAFNFWYIEDRSNGTLAQFDKRRSSSSSMTSSPEAVFPEADIEALV